MDATAQSPETSVQAPWGRVRRGRHLADQTLKVVCAVFTAVGVGNLWAITGWNICFILLGLALLHHASTTVYETT